MHYITTSLVYLYMTNACKEWVTWQIGELLISPNHGKKQVTCVLNEGSVFWYDGKYFVALQFCQVTTPT